MVGNEQTAFLSRPSLDDVPAGSITKQAAIWWVCGWDHVLLKQVVLKNRSLAASACKGLQQQAERQCLVCVACFALAGSMSTPSPGAMTWRRSLGSRAPFACTTARPRGCLCQVCLLATTASTAAQHVSCHRFRMAVLSACMSIWRIHHTACSCPPREPAPVRPNMRCRWRPEGRG